MSKREPMSGAFRAFCAVPTDGNKASTNTNMLNIESAIREMEEGYK